MSDRLRAAFDTLVREMEPPPTWEEVTAHQARPTGSPARRWVAFAGAAGVVLLIGVVAALLQPQGPIAAGPVPYVRIDWSQTVEMRCQGMETIDNGGFDNATIEIWGPNAEGLYRVDATAPDGTVERLIAELNSRGVPVRTWSSTPSFQFEDRTVFRVTDCARTTSDGSASFSVAQPPIYPVGQFPQEFSDYPEVGPEGESIDLEDWLSRGYETLREDDWRGRPVTIFVQEESGTGERGAYRSREELWVDLEGGRVERHLVEAGEEVTGSVSVTMEVTERGEAAPRDVSFDTDDLTLAFERPDLDDSNDEVVVTTSIPALSQPLMEEAVEIQPAEIPSPELRQAVAAAEGDQIYLTEVDGLQVVVRLRAATRPHMYATSCDALAEIELPGGWDGTCLERTVDGQRQTGTFPYDPISE